MKSGKSTLAKALWPYKTLSFAGPIREALKVIGIDKRDYPDLYRKGAQYIGTDLVRAEYPDWWVRQMEIRVDELPDNHNIVIDDMRFKNEYDWCDKNGFILVRLDVTEETQIARGAEPDRLYHPSETGLDMMPESVWDIWLPEETTIQERVELVMAAVLRADAISRAGSFPVRV